jgi:hypothetical protein
LKKRKEGGREKRWGERKKGRKEGKKGKRNKGWRERRKEREGRKIDSRMMQFLHICKRFSQNILIKRAPL